MPWLEPVTLRGAACPARAVVARPSRRPHRGGEGRRSLEALVHRDPARRRHDQGNRSPARPAGGGLDAAVDGVRCRRQDRRHDHLHECRCHQPPRRDRLDLVRQAGAAQRAQHPVQIAAAAACVRKARLHRGRIPHAFLQPPEPARHRAAGRQAGRHPAQPSDRAERHAARHRRVQHHRQRMADGEGASRPIN